MRRKQLTTTHVTKAKQGKYMYMGRWRPHTRGGRDPHQTMNVKHAMTTACCSGEGRNERCPSFGRTDAHTCAQKAQHFPNSA